MTETRLQNTAVPIARRALPALTGLRFFAAAQVVLFHLYAAIPRLKATPEASVVGLGFSGVSLFFVLSGFVLAYNYITPGQRGIGPLRRFLLARFARIYVVYLLGIVIALPIFVRLLQQDGRAAPLLTGSRVTLLSLSLLQAWVPNDACQLNCPGWSLSVEAFFYAMFPLLAVPLARLAPNRLPWMAVVCWSLSMLSAALYVVLRPDGGAVATAALEGTWINVLRFNPLVHLPEFALGMTVGVLFLRRAPGPADVRGLAAGAAFVIAVLLLLGRHIPYPMMHNGVMAPAVAVLLYALAAGGGLLERLLATPVMQQLGGASYALYVLHAPLLVWFKKCASLLGADVDQSAWLPATYVVTSILLALLVFHGIEEPARRWIRRLSANR